MLYHYHNPTINSWLFLTDHIQQDYSSFPTQGNLLRLVWNRSDVPVEFLADGIPKEIAPHSMVAITYINHVVWDKNTHPLTTFAFNKEFYCMQQHDHEVSCYGILFFGAQYLPIIALPLEELGRFEMLYQIFVEEFKYNDQIQGEMLLVLLKRLIIKLTRLAKKQIFKGEIEDEKLEIIRQFNFLVDIHYKEQKQVTFYADALHKSPKTLSNFFHLHSNQTPQKIIHERIALEAKRLLLFTNKSAKEIAYELGFAEANQFSKFFKKMFQKAPLEYRQSQKKEN